MQGTVKFFNEDKGFGFISGDDETDYFVHKSNLLPKVILTEGVEVIFDPMEGDRGMKATNVSLA